MTMQIITEAEAALHRAEALFTSIGHAGAAKVKALIAELRGDETTLQQEAVADAEQVAHDAQPVVAEVEHDAGQLATEAEHDASELANEAVADAEAAAQPPAAS